MVTGDRIKKCRLTIQITQKDLSAKLGLTPKMISFYEKNERIPPADILIKLSKIFNVTTDYLLGITDDESSKISNIILDTYEEQFIMLLRKLDPDYKDIVLGELKKCLKLQEQEHYQKQVSIKNKKQA